MLIIICSKGSRKNALTIKYSTKILNLFLVSAKFELKFFYGRVSRTVK